MGRAVGHFVVAGVCRRLVAAFNVRVKSVAYCYASYDKCLFIGTLSFIAIFLYYAMPLTFDVSPLAFRKKLMQWI